MNNELFIPYELALKLKGLGFDNDCLRWYDQNGEFVCRTTQKIDCKAPLWQQAFDFLFEKFGYVCKIENNLFYDKKVEKLSQEIKAVAAWLEWREKVRKVKGF